MICRISSRGVLTGFLKRLALLLDGRKDFSALVIILPANSYNHEMEGGATHEEIQEQRRGEGREEL
jgi:hypothetical protein